MSLTLTAAAWIELLHMDLIVFRGFPAIRRVVKTTPTATPNGASVEEVVEAMTRACVWYFRSPKCLQRSAVVTRLLRKRGVPAELVVGCHLEPMRGHAWVEVSGKIVSDRAYGLEHYTILERW
jgi:hypothetical protein